MITLMSALVAVQASALQLGAGVAVAPGGQFGPVARVTKSWPIDPHLSFRLEGVFSTAGVAGTHTICTIPQCFTGTVEFRAREIEVPTLLMVSVGPRRSLFFTGGLVFAARIACSGAYGGTAGPCANGSDLAWGGAIGAGVRAPIGARAMTLEVRSHYFSTPLVQLSKGGFGLVNQFRPRAVTFVVGWGRR